jgi:heme/copper-type cytochrome/quinol oxidase subunit 1
MVSSVGSYITADRHHRFRLSMLYAYFVPPEGRQQSVGLGATTLEWTLPSPPAFHSYEKLPSFKEPRTTGERGCRNGAWRSMAEWERRQASARRRTAVAGGSVGDFSR